jgi:hypothetical protein
MRNAAFFSVIVFIGLCSVFVPRYENSGLWWAFVGYVVTRGLSLLVLLPRLRAAVGWSSAARSVK